TGGRTAGFSSSDPHPPAKAASTSAATATHVDRPTCLIAVKHDRDDHRPQSLGDDLWRSPNR
ncbi:MAG: hypothetical protein ACRDMV_01510, partial [Streptosporangiales bacterium]